MRRLAAAFLLAPLALGGCGAAEPFRMAVPLGLDLYAPVPDDNPLTRSRITLGQRLFLDPSLSADGTVSCASCHLPGSAFADSVARSRGVYGRIGRRNAPALVNAAYREALFWDGRETSLERLMLHPIQDAQEMDRSLDELVVLLQRRPEVRRAFRRAFGQPVSAENVGRALASFVRSLRSGNSLFDRYRNGEVTALSPDARRGLALFTGRAHCTTCHAGLHFTDGQFHNTGIAVTSGDPGRYAVTGQASDRGSFRTPTLRDVALTAPYMHDGSIATLEAVVDFYAGGGQHGPNLDPAMRPLLLTADERRALVTFLEALSGG